MSFLLIFIIYLKKIRKNVRLLFYFFECIFSLILKNSKIGKLNLSLIKSIFSYEVELKVFFIFYSRFKMKLKKSDSLFNYKESLFWNFYSFILEREIALMQ